MQKCRSDFHLECYNQSRRNRVSDAPWLYSNRGPLVPSGRGGQMGLGKPSAPTWFERRRRALAGRQRVPPVQAGHIEDTFSLRMGFCFEAVPDEGTIRSPHWHGCRRWHYLSWFGFRLLKTDRISEERHSTSPHHENRWWVVFRLEVCLIMHFFWPEEPSADSSKYVIKYWEAN